MAVAFYIPSVDEDEPVKPNQASYHHHYQQVEQQQQQHQQPQQAVPASKQSQPSVASSDVSQQVCAEAMAEFQRQHLMMVLQEILIAYTREAVFARQQSASPKSLPASEPCLLCKKLYYLFRRFY